MLILATTTDLLELVTDAAATVDVHASWMDYNGTTVTPGKTNTAITTAGTTTIVPAPGASTQRNAKTLHIRNKHASLAVTVTLNFDQNATNFELFKVVLQPNDSLEYVEGIGFFTLASATPALILFNQATTSQALGAVDVYLAGSFIVFPREPKIGTRYQLRFDSVKTAAGTATPIITVRFGTAGTTSDTARNTLTLGAQTAAVDTATFDIAVVIRASGASGVAQASIMLSHVLDSTGYSIGGAAVQSTSAAFDLTVAGLGIGVSFNGGTAHSGTLQYLAAEVMNG